MRAVLLSAIVFGGLLALVTRDAGGVPTGYPGRNGLLAFELNGDIYTVEPSGRGKRLLRGSNDVDDRAWYPTWSPNGQTILFAHGARGNNIVLKTIHATGGGERKRRDAAYLYGPFAWSPDGRRIAAAGLAVDHGDSYTVLFVGTQQITRSPPRPFRQADTSPAWSSDGALLCFARTLRDGTSLFLKRPDGSAPRLHTRGAAPDWSPDARRIVFTDRGDLFVIDRDGYGRRRLTQTRQAEAAPVWSPDGTEIAFRRAGSLWATPVSGGRERLILRGVGDRAEPDWQPLLR